MRNLMKKPLFLNLTAFSQTGGIERFNRCFLKAMSDLDKQEITNSYSLSAYDTHVDSQYYDAGKYRGFAGNKLLFVMHSVFKAREYDTVVLGHINLSIAGLFIKWLYPSKKLMLIVHGIDVWGELSLIKRMLLKKTDSILAVSNYTKDKLLEKHAIANDKVQVFPNTIDPYFPIPSSVQRNNTLRNRYGLTGSDFILYTLTRLSHTETYKGYDKVIAAVATVIKDYPAVKYIIAGKYDDAEKKRIDGLIDSYDLQGKIILTGFLDESELVEHYQMADVYIMPSKKEGFGIVFIEAMICGLPVIAGNQDGSVDALQSGETGTLVNPDDTGEIEHAIRQALLTDIRNDEGKLEQIKEKTLNRFSFQQYKQRLRTIISTN